MAGRYWHARQYFRMHKHRWPICYLGNSGSNKDIKPPIIVCGWNWLERRIKECRFCGLAERNKCQLPLSWSTKFQCWRHFLCIFPRRLPSQVNSRPELQLLPFRSGPSIRSKSRGYYQKRKSENTHTNRNLRITRGWSDTPNKAKFQSGLKHKFIF